MPVFYWRNWGKPQTLNPRSRSLGRNRKGTSQTRTIKLPSRPRHYTEMNYSGLEYGKGRTANITFSTETPKIIGTEENHGVTVCLKWWRQPEYYCFFDTARAQHVVLRSLPVYLACVAIRLLMATECKNNTNITYVQQYFFFDMLFFFLKK